MSFVRFIRRVVVSGGGIWQHSDSSDSSTGTGSLGSTSAPATKMSRVLGTSVEQESTFLNERIGNQYGIAKNSRKVPTK
jgi:hypothetical protein